MTDKMINGMTDAGTAATASVAGLTPNEAPITEDQCIELTAALELHRALRIAADVAGLEIGGKNAALPTSFQAGYQLACEEITERLRTEVHELPGGLRLPQCGTLPSTQQPSVAVRCEQSPGEDIGHVSAADAREALDSLDDFARMTTGVDAVGPRRTLEAFISQAEAAQAAPSLVHRGWLLEWLGPGGKRSTVWSDTNATAKAVGCPHEPVYAMRSAEHAKTPLGQYDCEQLPGYHAGREDGRIVGHEVGYRHATEHAAAMAQAANDRARAALELIAAPMRPDGTWNRSREACQQLAAEVLGRDADAPAEDKP